MQSGSPIQLIVGLGNPGPQYEETRHNAGFWFVDLLARRHGGSFRVDSKFHGESCTIRIGGEECRLLKPATFMNRSGRALVALAAYFKIPPESILVAHDELDLPADAVRLKFAGGHGGHNGLRDIIGQLGSPNFWRLRIGIAHPGSSREVVDYVLTRPSREDREAIEANLAKAADALPDIVIGKQQQAMNRLHGSR